jgi:hypothetical protein
MGLVTILINDSWMEAETACTKALGQHRSGKGYFRRAKARKMLGKADEAIRGSFYFDHVQRCHLN